MEEKSEDNNDNFNLLNIWKGVLFGIFILLIVWFLTKKSRLRERKEQLEEKKRILVSLKLGNVKNYEKYKKIQEKLPFYIRLVLLVFLIVVDLGIYYISKDSYKSDFGIAFITHILKDISIWNFSILSIFIVWNFVVSGKFGNTEKAVEFVVSKAENYIFEPYISRKIELRVKSKESLVGWDESDILLIDIELQKTDEELSKI